jgi:type VII secretion protein EccB
VVVRPSLRLQAGARRYLNRRLERALLRGDPTPLLDSAWAPWFSVTVGGGLAVLGVLGCAAISLIRPAGQLGDDPIVMDSKTGALYVRVDDIVHPVLNLTSARLIAHTGAEPRPVAAAALRATKRGALLGIPGAPVAIGAPLPAEDSAWTVCDGARTTVIAGPIIAGHGGLAADEPMLVAGPTGTVYLLYDGHRAALSPTDPAVSRALRIDGIEPRVVSAAFLNTIPETAPITAPRIPGVGGPAPAALAGFHVGDVVRVERAEGTDHYVVLDGGVQRIGVVAADLIRFGGADSSTAIPAVAAATISAIPTLGVLPVDTFPDRPVAPRHQNAEVLCAAWAAGVVMLAAGDHPPVPAGQRPVVLAQADDAGPAVDQVYVPPGRSVYVRPEGGASLTGAVVVDTGVRYPVADAEATRVLALPERASPAPWGLLSALPAGPVLSRDGALVARDVVSERTSQPGDG